MQMYKICRAGLVYVHATDDLLADADNWKSADDDPSPTLFTEQRALAHIKETNDRFIDLFALEGRMGAAAWHIRENQHTLAAGHHRWIAARPVPADQ